MCDDLRFPMVIDERLERYKTFFDHNWSNRILAKTKGTRLEVLVFDLCINWKSTVNSHILPWFAVEWMSGVAQGMSKGTDSPTIQQVKRLADRLEERLGSTLNNMGRKRLRQTVAEMTQSVSVICENLPPVLPSEEVWAAFLDDNHSGTREFHIAVWASQRLCYGSLYHAYESFLRRCLELHLGQPDYHKMGAEFAKDLASTFGKTIACDCFSNDQIAAAREVRNALAHNGGRVGPKLARLQHGIRVEKDTLQVMPDDNRRLFELLKVGAEKLVDKALTLIP